MEFWAKMNPTMRPGFMQYGSGARRGRSAADILERSVGGSRFLLASAGVVIKIAARSTWSPCSLQIARPGGADAAKFRRQAALWKCLCYQTKSV